MIIFPSCVLRCILSSAENTRQQSSCCTVLDTFPGRTECSRLVLLEGDGMIPRQWNVMVLQKAEGCWWFGIAGRCGVYTALQVCTWTFTILDLTAATFLSAITLRDAKVSGTKRCCCCSFLPTRTFRLPNVKAMCLGYAYCEVSIYLGPPSATRPNNATLQEA